MKKWLATKILKWWGWKIEGFNHNHIPKKLFIVAPHTSNWDFPIGLLLNAALSMDVGYMAKHTLFKPPFGWFFRSTGGIPVDRTRRTNIIDSVAEIYNTRERFCTAISPEGKRKKVTKFRKGFYYIAQKANVPIVYVIFGWGTKTITFFEPKMIEDTVEKELEYAYEIYRGQIGKIPEYSFGYPSTKEV